MSSENRHTVYGYSKQKNPNIVIQGFSIRLTIGEVRGMQNLKNDRPPEYANFLEEIIKCGIKKLSHTLKNLFQRCFD